MQKAAQSKFSKHYVAVKLSCRRIQHIYHSWQPAIFSFNLRIHLAEKWKRLPKKWKRKTGIHKISSLTSSWSTRLKTTNSLTTSDAHSQNLVQGQQNKIAQRAIHTSQICGKAVSGKLESLYRVWTRKVRAWEGRIVKKAITMATKTCWLQT